VKKLKVVGFALSITAIIDRTGRVVERQLGFTEKSEIESEIEHLVGP
jgi:hypothetical protein